VAATVVSVGHAEPVWPAHKTDSPQIKLEYRVALMCVDQPWVATWESKRTTRE
jgi:hypothetical protein